MPRVGNMHVNFARCTCTQHVEEKEENSALQTMYCLDKSTSICINSLAIRHNHGSHVGRASGFNVLLNKVKHEVFDVPRNIVVNSSKKEVNNYNVQKLLAHSSH